MKKIWYSLHTNYYTVDKPDRALETYSPAKSLKDGLEMFTNTIMLQKCSDNETIPARATLNKCVWDSETNKTKTTVVVSNELAVSALLFGI